MFFYVAGRDPGIIDAEKFRDEPLNMDVLVRKSNTIDDYNGGWSDQKIYQARPCSTCKITRPPLSSHCSICNVCVYGFDHHCTLFNTCIGVRNHRAFLVTILFVYLSYGSLAALGFVLVVYEDLIEESIM